MKITRMVITTLLFLIVIPITINAESRNVTIDTKLREEQLFEESTSYHAIYTDGGKEEVFEYVIKNNSNEVRTIKITPLSAITTNVGEGVYKNDIDIDKYYVDPNFALGGKVRVIEDIELQPNSEETVEVIVDVPSSFDKGEMTLAIGFTEINDDDENDSELNMSIKTETMFVSGIVLKNKIKDPILFSFEGDLDIKQNPNGMSLLFPIQNNSATIFKNIVGMYKVMDKDGNVIINEKLIMNRFYPKNKVWKELYLNEELLPNIYTVSLNIDVDGQLIGIEKDIKITEEKIEEEKEELENSLGISNNKDTTQYFLVIVLISLLVILLIVIIFLILIIKKKKKENEIKEGEKNEE